MDGALPDAEGAVRAAHPPAFPAAWYMLAGAREVRPGRVLARSLHGHEIVLWRDASGAVRAMDGHCAHMGCHLKHGTVTPDGLRCALHHRVIGADGAFSAGGLRQRLWPVREHLGAVFVRAGRTDAPLPQPSLAASGPVVTRFLGRFTFDVPWHALIANGFDMEHLASVHRRALQAPARVETEDGWFRLSYRSRVTGRSLSDRVMKALSGNDIGATMTSVGGPLMLVESDVARPSFSILSMLPRPGGGTEITALIGQRSGRLDGPRLRLAGWLFKRFFQADVAIFDGLDWHLPARAANKADGDTARLWQYFCGLDAADG